MKLLVIGKNGQVGGELLKALPPSFEVSATDRSTLDLARPEQIASVIQASNPQVIINAAAYTAVDKAESDQATAQAINATAPGVMADAAKSIGALLVHYSTDYVFDGEKDAPYTEDDAPAPLGVYGRTKLDGERAIQASGCRYLILRTEWVYGPYGANFLLTMLRLAASRPELHVVDDQFGAPTSARMIAEATARVLSAGIPQDNGLYHMTAAGRTTWCGFARAILAGSGSKTPVVAIPTKDYPTPAARPRNSLFDNSRFEKRFGFRLPAWEEGLRQCLQTLAKG
ncbi:MAG TPA: dTDP-4-dehydrorhamnose reductase [Burkholderiales bacterium]|nr:dTDP-4-dehydrorhamnose reductase [Burkholderiales bacterium]